MVKFKDIPTMHSSDPALWDDDARPVSLDWKLSEATKKELEAIDASLNAASPMTLAFANMRRRWASIRRQ